MASITGITAAEADQILGMSVVSGHVDASGHLILTRANGQTIDGGDFTTTMTAIMNTLIPPEVATQVFNSVAGTLFNKGNVSGAVDFKTVPTGTPPTNVTLVNAMFVMTLTGNITIDMNTAVPAGTIKPGTQFAVKMIQDGTGNRLLTVNNAKKSQGALLLTTTANAYDILVFVFDGTNWNVGFMGVDFK